MNILSATYANHQGGILLEREGEPALYVDSCELYERALAGEFGDLGELPEPEAEPDAPVPQVVSRFQARAALLQSDLLDAAEAAVAEGEAIIKLAWEDAQEFRRHSPTIAALAGELGLSSEQVDDLFRLAATIEA